MSGPDALTAEPRDALAAVTHVDPAPFFRQLRATQPLFRDESLKLWVASSAEGVQAALAHAALRVRPPAEPVPRALTGTPAGEIFGLLVRMNDGAFHAQHKPVVNVKVSALKLRQISQLSVDMAPGLQQRFSANELLAELPVRVMASALGVGDNALDDVAIQVRAFARGIAAGAQAKELAAVSVATTALMAYWHQRGCSTTEAAHRIGLMQQSLDATAGLLGNTVLLLQRRPDLAAVWMRSHDEARALVAEVARWDAPVQNTRRFAAEPLSLLGQRIDQGDGVLLVLASGNRDGLLNERPDDFDPGRQHRKSLTFGSGAHACPAEEIAIEIVAACARIYWADSRFDAYFEHFGAYLPLQNARVPVFKN